MERKLIALDMDGTLLTSAKILSLENKKAIKEAQAVGHTILISSGRPHDGLITYLEEEGLGDLPISASNGTITLVDGEIIDRVVMDVAVAKIVFKWLSDNEYPVNLYTDQGVWGHVAFLERAERETKEHVGEINSQGHTFGMMAEYLNKTIKNYFEFWDELPKNLGIFKFFVYTPDPIKKIAFEDFAKTFYDLNVTSSYAENVEISDVNGHKGAGVKAVAKHFGIPIENTVAIGDNFNDLGMLEVAGLAIAMGNAEDGIKEIADVITLSNDEHGVAHAIREYVL